MKARVVAAPQKKRGDGEDDDAGEEEALASEAEGEPVAGGEDDGVGDEIAGEHPGGFVVGGGERAGDVGEGDRGDGGVEHLHEGGQHDGDGDEPWIDALGRPQRSGRQVRGRRWTWSGLLHEWGVGLFASALARDHP